jgi:biotin synthase-like enzyme
MLTNADVCRLDTIGKVREAGISVCSGGIIGMGELDKDRVGLIHTLATLPEHPGTRFTCFTGTYFTGTTVHVTVKSTRHCI